jgi:hypothetical protein
MEERLNKESTINFYTTDAVADFDKQAEVFFGKKVSSKHLDLASDKSSI